MGIYITDMKKPKHCYECFFISKCSVVPRWISKVENVPLRCPIVEDDFIEFLFNNAINPNQMQRYFEMYMALPIPTENKKIEGRTIDELDTERD